MRNEKYKNWEEGWAVVEMEDDVIAGWVACEDKFLQVDVPEREDVEWKEPAFTRFISLSVVRSITPCSNWGVFNILEERNDETLCDAFHLNAYTQHARGPRGDSLEPIDPEDIPF